MTEDVFELPGIRNKDWMDSWANFFFNEKLDPAKMDEESMMELVWFCEQLSKMRAPCIRMHMDKLQTRKYACYLAMDLGIDLMEFRDKRTGKHLIGRGLLDMWNEVYTKRFGSTVGTRGAWEAKRRDCKIKLTQQGIKGVR